MIATMIVTLFEVIKIWTVHLLAFIKLQTHPKFYHKNTQALDVQNYCKNNVGGVLQGWIFGVITHMILNEIWSIWNKTCSYIFFLKASIKANSL